MIRKTLAVLTALLLASPLWADTPPAVQPEFTTAQTKKLSRGEIVMIPGQCSGQAGIAVQIDASRNSIWSVLTDPESAPSYMDTLREAELLKEFGNTQIIFHKVKIGFLPAVEYDFKSVSTPMKSIAFEQIEGDLRDFKGGWQLLDGEALGLGGKMILFYHVYLDPGRFVPQGMVQRSLQKDLPPMMLSVRKRILAVQAAAGAAQVATR